jgi:hypothetical protein
MATQLDGCRQGYRNQTCILAGEKETQEIRVGFGDQCNAIALLQSHAEQLAGKYMCRLTQLSIGKRRIQGTSACIEICSGTALCCIVESLAQSSEVRGTKRQFMQSWCRFCFQNRLFPCRILKTSKTLSDASVTKPE